MSQAGCPNCKQDHDEIGTRDQPATRAAWFKIGDQIINQSTVKHSESVVVVPPGLKTPLKSDDAADGSCTVVDVSTASSDSLHEAQQKARAAAASAPCVM